LWADASGLATPPDNFLQHLAVATIPAGTTVFIGTVADNFPDGSGRFAKGGNTQIFIPHVVSFPFREYRFAAEGREVSDITIVLDDRTLRFRQ
jgi:hypothetical protein